MAVDYVNGTIANGDTVSVPAHLKGDLIVGICYRASTSTLPTIPGAGWTVEYDRTSAVSSNSGVFLVLSKIAESNSETFGTATNATQCACLVFRPNGGGPCIVADFVYNSSGTTFTGNHATAAIPSFSLQDAHIHYVTGIRDGTGSLVSLPDNRENLVSVTSANSTGGQLLIDRHEDTLDIIGNNSPGFSRTFTATNGGWHTCDFTVIQIPVGSSKYTGAISRQTNPFSVLKKIGAV